MFDNAIGTSHQTNWTLVKQVNQDTSVNAMDLTMTEDVQGNHKPYEIEDGKSSTDFQSMTVSESVSEPPLPSSASVRTQGTTGSLSGDVRAHASLSLSTPPGSSVRVPVLDNHIMEHWNRFFLLTC